FEGSAVDDSVLVDLTVLHAEGAFDELRAHAQQAGHDHPECRARTAEAMATPTPAMLPSPTVPDRAEARAWKWVTSPGSSFVENFPRMISIDSLAARAWMKPK